MSQEWLVVLGVAATAVGLKAVGPVVVGQRKVPARLARVLELLPVAILSALVVTQGFATGDRLVLDARIIGLAIAAVLVWRGAPLGLVVVSSAMAAAVARSIGWAT